MIINGLRISCATTVDSRPSDDSRSRCAASRWKRAIESVIVLNVVASSRASSSSHGAAGRRVPARQVAGRRHLAHRRGNRAERPRDRARDRVAQERRRQHRDHGDDPSRPVQRVEKTQALGPRAQDDRARSLPGLGRRAVGRMRARQRVVAMYLAPSRTRATGRRAEQRRQRRPELASAASTPGSRRRRRTRCRCSSERLKRARRRGCRG